MQHIFKVPPALAAGAVLTALAVVAQPALARDGYVNDGAGMFTPATVASLNREIGDFNRQSGKEVVVVTVPSLGGKTLNAAAEDAFAREQVNGVLFFFAKAEKQDLVVGDRASQAFFPAGSLTNIHDAMRGYLRGGDPDQAIATGVNLVLDHYRGHLGSLSSSQRVPAVATRPLVVGRSSGSSLGGAMSLFWLALVLVAGFIIIRGIFRALSGPRMIPPGVGTPGVPGPGYGPGYGGPGYGYGGGGGFFSGLLGGLGGAWLGNELFSRGGGSVGEPGTAAGMTGDASGSADASGWQSDPGQADVGNAGGGSWGDTGGGFDPGGGGGGGFDAGGGGGDGGGGW